MKTIGKIHNINDAVTYLDSFANYEKISKVGYQKNIFNLNVTNRLLQLFGNPHLQLKVIHVAGTKGKGSICSMLANALMHCGCKTGLYLSPHVLNIRERFQSQGIMIQESAFIWFTNSIKKILGDYQDVFTATPTTFELLTVIAFLFFAEENVQWAVMETGLGGRLDATNIVLPEICVITPISLDHTMELGNTIEAIAKEKAGIIKPGVDLVCAKQTRKVMAVIEKKCTEKTSRMHRSDKDFHVVFRELKGSFQECSFRKIKGKIIKVNVGLPGKHQVDNTAVAMDVLEVLKQQKKITMKADCFSGWRTLRMTGRFQMIGRQPLFILDGAHNVASIAALCETIKEVFPRRAIKLIFGLLRDKNAYAIAKILRTITKFVVITRVPNVRSYLPNELFQIIRNYFEHIEVIPNVSSAIKWCKKKAQHNEIVVITGSFYLVGESLRLLRADIKSRGIASPF